MNVCTYENFKNWMSFWKLPLNFGCQSLALLKWVETKRTEKVDSILLKNDSLLATLMPSSVIQAANLVVCAKMLESGSRATYANDELVEQHIKMATNISLQWKGWAWKKSCWVRTYIYSLIFSKGWKIGSDSFTK